MSGSALLGSYRVVRAYQSQRAPRVAAAAADARDDDEGG